MVSIVRAVEIFEHLYVQKLSKIKYQIGVKIEVIQAEGTGKSDTGTKKVRSWFHRTPPGKRLNGKTLSMKLHKTTHSSFLFPIRLVLLFLVLPTFPLPIFPLFRARQPPTRRPTDDIIASITTRLRSLIVRRAAAGDVVTSRFQRC